MTSGGLSFLFSWFFKSFFVEMRARACSPDPLRLYGTKMVLFFTCLGIIGGFDKICIFGFCKTFWLFEFLINSGWMVLLYFGTTIPKTKEFITSSLLISKFNFYLKMDFENYIKYKMAPKISMMTFFNKLSNNFDEFDYEFYISVHISIFKGG